MKSIPLLIWIIMLPQTFVPCIVIVGGFMIILMITLQGLCWYFYLAAIHEQHHHLVGYHVINSKKKLHACLKALNVKTSYMLQRWTLEELLKLCKFLLNLIQEYIYHWRKHDCGIVFKWFHDVVLRGSKCRLGEQLLYL